MWVLGLSRIKLWLMIRYELSEDYDLNGQNKVVLRPHAMAGFYVWQMHGYDQFQNDAILYGMGVDLELPILSITNSVGGYYGYLGIGDRPMVYRLNISSKRDALFNYELRLQQGLRDFEYTSVRIACNMNLGKGINP